MTAAGALILTVRFYDQSRPRPALGLRKALVVLRCAALLLLLLGMAGPLLTHLTQRRVPARLVLALEDSGSMALEHEAGGRTRWETALGLVNSLAEGLAGMDLAGTEPAVAPWLARGNGLQPLRLFQRDDAVIPEPAAHGTSLGGLLRQIKTATTTEPVAAWVLLADGNETQPDSGPATTPDAPFFVVGLGDTEGSADRMITDLRYPDTAFAEDRITVEATVVDRFTESPGTEPVVVRLREGDTVLAEQSVRLRDGAAQVSLDFLPGRAGLRILELEVSPGDNERFLTNNRVSLGIDVRKARSRVLVLAPRPGWDVRFLCQAASREMRLSLEVVHRTATGLAFADSLVPFSPPTTAAGWRRYEAVILVGWEDLPQDLDLSLLADAVREGVGLLVLPRTPGTWARAERMPRPAASLAEILPVELGQGRWRQQACFVRPDSLAAEHPVLSRVLAPGSGALADQLPPLPAVLDVGLKPGARALLTARPRGGREAAGFPLLSLWQPGRGRAVFWSGARLWELAFWQPSSTVASREQPPAVERLLRNLMVWLADGTRESGLRFAGRRAFYQEGEGMALAARWRDMRGLPVTDRLPILEVRPLGAAADAEDESEATDSSMRFSSPGYDPQREEFPFRVPALPPGRYVLRLEGPGDPPVEGQAKEIIITAHSVEETQVRQDARRLKQLAARLQGRYLDARDPAVASRLLRELAALDWSGRRLSDRQRWNPTEGWPFLVVVVLLLGCEWFLRRRHGLL